MFAFVIFKPNMRNRFFGGVLVCAFLASTPFARAASADLSLDSSNISFSASTLYVGDTVRIYARVRNVGDTDATATVMFYQGGMIIGQSQPVSLRASGNPDDVFVDFTVPEGSFNIRAVIQGSAPQDTNPDNDSAMTPLYEPISDADRDGVVDDVDDCVDDINTDQLDTDKDGKGNACDTDDDNDGVADTSDPAPLDATETGIVVQAPAPAVKAAPATTSAPSGSVPGSSTPPVANSISTSTSEVPSDAGLQKDVRSISTSKLSTSPFARFTWRQIDWRTYEFILAEQPTDGVRFSWDFGDGSTSVQSKITHAFSGPGTFTVTLAILNTDGTSLSDAQTFDVSFFHLGNPQVLLLIGTLILALFLFGFAFIKLRKSYDKGALHE